MFKLLRKKNVNEPHRIDLKKISIKIISFDEYYKTFSYNKRIDKR